MTNEEKLKFFEKELNSILDLNIRTFTENILCDTDDWFYHEPASTSGKHHPKFALGDGGLARHTRAVVYFVNEFLRAEAFGITEKSKEGDLLRAAAISHDIMKHKNGRFVKDHAAQAAEFLRLEYVKYPKLVDQKDIDYMCRVVETHMGIWGKPAPDANEEWLLHLADLCASRREIEMEFPDYDPNAEVVEEPKEPVTVDTYVFEYGKHRGKTIAEAAATDMEYLTWIASKEDFNHADSRNLIIEYLSRIK